METPTRPKHSGACDLGVDRVRRNDALDMMIAADANAKPLITLIAALRSTPSQVFLEPEFASSALRPIDVVVSPIPGDKFGNAVLDPRLRPKADLTLQIGNVG